MKIIKRFLQLIVLVPFGIVMISLAVANRHDVKLALDPFSPEQPVLDFTLPLYMVIFGALLVGVFIGGFMAWLKQGRHRKAAREKRYEAQRWRNEADRQQKRLEKLAADPKSDVPALPASGPTAITKVAM
ncbi:LapA family protein [Cohaesibacter haloalkalitolerans]|uniref:LapA family protein n=1 Tax=Cohaesibacter haloalkalitolerans TaxID=1162980 RepID=UPI000E64CFD1|nr:LapA family protein [Cohaesibacter haloalkalitolerans]